MVSARDLSNEVAEVVVAGRGAAVLAAAYLVRSPSHHHFTVFISCNGLWGLVSRYNVNERNSERTLYARPLVWLMGGGGGKSTSAHDSKHKWRGFSCHKATTSPSLPPQSLEMRAEEVFLS